MEPNQIQQKSNGALIGLVIIVIILIIGGIYMWQKNIREKAQEQNSNLVSGDTASLEASVQSMDLDSLDSGM